MVVGVGPYWAPSSMFVVAMSVVVVVVIVVVVMVVVVVVVVIVVVVMVVIVTVVVVVVVVVVDGTYHWLASACGAVRSENSLPAAGADVLGRGGLVAEADAVGGAACRWS